MLPPNKRRRVLTVDALWNEDHQLQHRHETSAARKRNSVQDTARRQFLDRVKLLSKRKANTPGIDAEPDGILSLKTVTAKHSEILLFTKAYEESLMRPPKANEAPCQNGHLCECHFIGPPVANTNGFVGVAVPDDVQCILCMRNAITCSYYHNLINEHCPTQVIQSHYNAVGQGEYSRTACFWPHRQVGISDPVVMHCRLNYYYDGGVIKQSPTVNFRLASS